MKLVVMLKHRQFTPNKLIIHLILLWVGKFDFRKQLALALKTIARLEANENVLLHIIGGDEQESLPYKTLAAELNIAENCIWYGKVSHAKVQLLMQQSHLFFFTSVAEGTPHVVLEAIANQLPVLSFNACGQGDTVNEQVGVKIPLSNPEISAKAFAQRIIELKTDPSKLESLQKGCIIRMQELSWENKAGEMVRLYNKIKQNA